MADTRCINANCPFTECERHLTKIEKATEDVSVANFDSVCREYISYLVDKAERGDKSENL